MPELAAHLERVARLAAIIEEHIPMESCAGEPGDAGCSCGEKFTGEYTWKGYCDHLAGKLAAALAACAREAKLEEALWWEHLVGDCHGTELASECVYCERILKLRQEIEAGLALERAAGEKAT